MARGPDDVRLRRDLDGPVEPARLPDGFSLRPMTPQDAPAVHDLLVRVFDDGGEGPFETWWEARRLDPEFDAALCFLVHDRHGRLAGAALSWTSAFLKDLAVDPDFRRQGIAGALLAHVFAAFRARGAAHVDLKTDTVLNADACRLYLAMGMREVDWAG